MNKQEGPLLVTPTVNMPENIFGMQGSSALMLKLKFLYLDVMTVRGRLWGFTVLRKWFTSNNGYLAKYGIKPEVILL